MRCEPEPLRSSASSLRDYPAQGSSAFQVVFFVGVCSAEQNCVVPQRDRRNSKKSIFGTFDEHNTVGQSQKTANTRGQQPSANLVALAIRSRVPLESPAVKIAWTWAHSKAVALWTSEQCEAHTAAWHTHTQLSSLKGQHKELKFKTQSRGLRTVDR